jgi:hypothetical protein
LARQAAIPADDAPAPFRAGGVMTRKSTKGRWLGGLAAAALLSASQAHALDVLPFFDTSITSDPNAAQIEGTINHAIGFYHAFSNPETVKIIYALAPVGLGASETTLYGGSGATGGIPFGDYAFLLALQSALHPENTVLASGVANLGTGNTMDILAPSANLRAFGLDTPGAFGTDGSFGMGGDYDAIVFLDPSAPINFGPTPVPGEFDATPVIQHETDEVLGTGGGGSLLGFGLPGLMGVEDIYRYNGPGSGSFSTDPGEHAYFSIDGGATDIKDFNQNGLGDFADWAKTSCLGPAAHVQDWAGCPFPLDAPVHLGLNSPEVTALQAIGYNLRTDGMVPEPATWTLMIGGFGLAGASLRRRRAAVAKA